MQHFGVPFWKKAPFIRLLVPLVAGILLQWYLQFPLTGSLMVIIGSAIVFVLLSMLPLISKFRYGGFTGAVIFILLASLGAVLTYNKNIRNDGNWFGHHYPANSEVRVTLQEPLIEKPNSFKAIASVNGFKGKIIIYFQKDSSIISLTYGSQFSFHQSLQLIRNAGNPGGFDYKRYCLFRGISHQVYLKRGDLEILPGKKEQWLDKALLNMRNWTLNILRKNIADDREGLAEALLIGYKNDLDQTLVQSYTNTGVVHVIAISGLHLALVYWLLLKLLSPLKGLKQSKWLHSVVVISGLWLFSLLAGAQASVLRAAVMFTIIVLAEVVTRKPNILNSLAASAFLMLCFNPYWLWDVGFQLSYAALLSIILFMKPIYNWFWIENGLLNFTWELAAVTISAQIFTLPVSIYHFHQLPSLFLLSNFLAVPLSSLIVLAEIFLCGFSWLEPVAALTGKFINLLINLMNTWVERIESIPYSLWDGLQISMLQMILLFVVIAGVGYGLIEKNKIGIWTGLAALLCFVSFRTSSFMQAKQQQKLIVYNVSKHSAIDIIDGRSYYFIGDSSLLEDDFLRNFNLKPSRIMHRIALSPPMMIKDNLITWHNKIILLIDGYIDHYPAGKNDSLDLIVFSKKASVSFSRLLEKVYPKQIVFDASLPYYKVKQWIKECDSLRLSYHYVAEKGAYVMNLK